MFIRLIAELMSMSGSSLTNPSYETDTVRVALLYKQSAIAQMAGLLNAGIYVYVSWKLVPTIQVKEWAGMIFVLYLVRFALQKWFNLTFVKNNRSFDAPFWENAFLVGTLLSGVLWGLTGTFLMPVGAMAHHAFLGFLLAGNTAGAIVAYCASKKNVQAFLIPATLPYAVMLALEGGEFQYSMAVLLVVFFVGMFTLSFRMNENVVTSIRLRFEKDHLLKELKETQAKVAYATKMVALGEMAGGIAHEINTPLATIRFDAGVLLELAGEKGLQPARVVQLAKKVDATAVRIASIVAGLKSFARDGSHDLIRRVSVKKIISETLDFCQTRFRNVGIGLEVGLIPSRLEVECRSVEISQVLLNLLNNSFDAVQGTSSPWVKIEVRKYLDHLCIEVSDSGPGISPALREKIMQPFFTTKEIGKGSGLGLSIAYRIMQSHGGSIGLDVTSHHTRFILTLPMEVAA